MSTLELCEEFEKDIVKGKQLAPIEYSRSAARIMLEERGRHVIPEIVDYLFNSKGYRYPELEHAWTHLLEAICTATPSLPEHVEDVEIEVSVIARGASQTLANDNALKAAMRVIDPIRSEFRQTSLRHMDLGGNPSDGNRVQVVQKWRRMDPCQM